MATVFIARRLRSFADGQAQVQVTGGTVRQIIEALDTQCPGMKAKLCEADGEGLDVTLIRGMAVTVDGVTSELGLLEKVGPDSEIHFLPAIAGG